jgi:hypothetical protein
MARQDLNQAAFTETRSPRSSTGASPSSSSLWTAIKPWGRRLTSFAVGVAAATAIASYFTARSGDAPSLAIPFLLSGLALAVASVCIWLEVRDDLVQAILGAMAAGSFGITLAEMSAQAVLIPDHYKSLWVPMALAGCLVAYRIFRREGHHTS